MDWIQTLYKETRAMWEQYGRNPSGYAIFYSPVKLNPDVLIIGYNPGGSEYDFDKPPLAPPSHHDYVEANYPMARKMRLIFTSAGLDLRNSVKTNLIFFRTKKSMEAKKLPPELIRFSKEQIKSIVDRINTRFILLESFETFDELKNILEIERMENIHVNNRCLGVLSIYGDKKVLAIPHPSRTVGLSNEHLKEIGNILKQQF